MRICLFVRKGRAQELDREGEPKRIIIFMAIRGMTTSLFLVFLTKNVMAIRPSKVAFAHGQPKTYQTKRDLGR